MYMGPKRLTTLQDENKHGIQMSMYHFIDFTCFFFAFTLLKGDFFTYIMHLVNLFTLCKHLWIERVLKSNKQTNLAQIGQIPGMKY